MSLRHEQYMALLKTRNFLRDLLSVDEYPKTKKEMRDAAYRCIKHFPFLQDNGKPIFSEDEFTKD